MVPAIALVRCSPIPLIQSPRIDSKFAINASIKNSGVSGINSAEPDIRSKQRFVADERIPVFISIGIRDRVELSGVVFPYWLYGLMWQGNVKVALFDLNREKRFGNLAAALFSGSTGYGGEHENKTNVYGGLSAGSQVPAGPGSLELVLQTSVSYEHEVEFENTDWFTIYWLQPAFGIVYRPVKRGLMEFSLGCNY
jgi:hypothetical protein